MPYKDAEAKKQYDKAYAATHKEQHSVASKKWRDANPDAQRSATKAWEVLNLDRVKARLARYESSHREPRRAKSHKYALAKLGLTLDDYNEMLEKQGGVCAICGLPPVEPYKVLCTDHDHKSNAVRGLLCNHCNLGIAHFKDDVGLLDKAKEYLNAR